MSDDKKIIRFDARVPPFPFKRVLSNGTVRFNDPNYEAFKYRVKIDARRVMKNLEPFDGYVRLTCIFYKEKPHDIGCQNWGDGDNFLKAIMDALQLVCYTNDAQVVYGTFIKRHGKPHVNIKLETITEEELDELC